MVRPPRAERHMVRAVCACVCVCVCLCVCVCVQPCCLRCRHVFLISYFWEQ